MFDVQVAVTQNRQFSRSLGWGSRTTEISTSFGISSRMPTEEEFAHGVWQWQRGQTGLEPDGVLGPNSWRQLSHQLDHTLHGNVRSWNYRGMSGTLLTGFDFDDATLKPDHEQWLAEFATRSLNRTFGAIFLIGLTDRTGTEGYNRELSGRRALTALRYLQRRQRSSLPIFIAALGESIASAASDRAESDRGVAVVYRTTSEPPVWLGRMLRPQPSKVFYIRAYQVFIFGVGIPPSGFKTFTITLQISDGIWSNFYTLTMAGFGLSGSIGLPFDVTVNTTGPWHMVRLPAERTVNDFGNASAEFSAVGVSAGRSVGGNLAVRFRNPSFRIENFRLGPDLTSDLFSISGVAGWGTVSRVHRHATQQGVPAIVQRQSRRAQN